MSALSPSSTAALLAPSTHALIARKTYLVYIRLEPKLNCRHAGSKHISLRPGLNDGSIKVNLTFSPDNAKFLLSLTWTLADFFISDYSLQRNIQKMTFSAHFDPKTSEIRVETNFWCRI